MISSSRRLYDVVSGAAPSFGNWASNLPGPSATPEPRSLLLLATGLLSVGGLARRRLRSSAAKKL